MGAGKETPSSTRRSSNEQEEPWKSPEAGGETHKGKQHTCGVPSSSTGVTKRDTFESLCLFQCLSHTTSPFLLLLCIYSVTTFTNPQVRCGGSVIPHPSRPTATCVSNRKLELRAH